MQPRWWSVPCISWLEVRSGRLRERRRKYFFPLPLHRLTSSLPFSAMVRVVMAALQQEGLTKWRGYPFSLPPFFAVTLQLIEAAAQEDNRKSTKIFLFSSFEGITFPVANYYLEGQFGALKWHVGGRENHFLPIAQSKSGWPTAGEDLANQSCFQEDVYCLILRDLFTITRQQIYKSFFWETFLRVEAYSVFCSKIWLTIRLWPWKQLFWPCYRYMPASYMHPAQKYMYPKQTLAKCYRAFLRLLFISIWNCLYSHWRFCILHKYIKAKGLKWSLAVSPNRLWAVTRGEKRPVPF